MIKIKPIGQFFAINERGYVVNPCQLSNIAPPWHAILQKVMLAVQHHFNGDILSLYVRGSVALGDGIEVRASDENQAAIVSVIGPYADLDLVMLVKPDCQRKQAQVNQWLQAFCTVQHIDCEIDLHLVDWSQLATDKKARLMMVLATQSLCLVGEDTMKSMLKPQGGYRPGPSMLLDSPWLLDDLDQFSAMMQINQVTPQAVQAICKVLIRVAFERVMAKAGKYTRSLYWCVMCFSEYYPQKSQAAEQLLHFYLNPTLAQAHDHRQIEHFALWLLTI